MEGAVVSTRSRPKRFLLRRRYKIMLQRSPHKAIRFHSVTNPKPATDFLSHVVPPAYAEQLAPMPEAEISETLAIHTIGSMAYVAELLKRVSKLSASEVEARRLQKELEACKKVLTTQEEKITTCTLEIDQAHGELTDAKATIVELKAHIFDISKRAVDKTTQAKAVNAKLRKQAKAAEEREKDMAERLEKLSLQKEAVEKKYASLVDDTDRLLGNGLPFFGRLLKSRDFLVESSYVQAACVEYGFQKGCVAMKEKLAVDLWDTKLPVLDPEIKKKVEEASCAFGEGKFDVLENMVEDDHVKASHIRSLSESLMT